MSGPGSRGNVTTIQSDGLSFWEGPFVNLVLQTTVGVNAVGVVANALVLTGLLLAQRTGRMSLVSAQMVAQQATADLLSCSLSIAYAIALVFAFYKVNACRLFSTRCTAQISIRLDELACDRDCTRLALPINLLRLAFSGPLLDVVLYVRLQLRATDS